MKNVLKMTMLLSNGKTVTYSLADPKDGLAKTEVQAVLEEMAEKRAVVVGDAFAVAMKEAYIQSTEKRELA